MPEEMRGALNRQTTGGEVYLPLRKTQLPARPVIIPIKAVCFKQKELHGGRENLTFYGLRGDESSVAPVIPM